MPVNLSGAIASTGYGSVLVNLLREFDRAGADPALFPLPTRGHVDWAAWPRDGHLIAAALRRADAFDPAAPSVKVWHQFDLAWGVGRGPRLGYFFTELDRLKPVEVAHVNSLDCAIQPSAWAAGVAAESGVTAPQTIVPCAVDTDTFVPDDLPPGDTVFVHAGKWEVRKGQQEVAAAFARAFAPGDAVRLVFLGENPFLPPEENARWARLVRNHHLGDRVEVVPRLPDADAVAALFRRCHCGVFPARAEGFNLEAAELLATGRHCILTDYAGHTTFGREAGAEMLPVPGLEYADDGVWFDSRDPGWTHPPTSQWLRGRHGRWASLGGEFVDRLALALRRFHERRLQGGLAVNEAGVRFFRRWTWADAARRILEACA